MINKWDKRFMNMAFMVANWSKDPTTRVGCVIVSNDRRHISVGYNGFPSRIKDNERLEVREVKRKLTVHAEVNAILNSPFPMMGHGIGDIFTLYTTHPPCLDCCTIIASKRGICRVVYARLPLEGHWESDEGLKLLKESAVFVESMEYGLGY